MKLIDIDRLKEIDSHIHYIKIYRGSTILMGTNSQIFRFEVEFSVEHKPIGPPEIKISFIEHPHFPLATIIKKMKDKIMDMNNNGVLATINKG